MKRIFQMDSLISVRSLFTGLATWWRGVVFIIRAAPLAASIYLALIFVSSLLPVLQVWLVKRIVDRLTEPGTDLLTLVSDGVMFALLYGSLLLILAGIEPIRQALAAKLEDQAVAEVDQKLMAGGAKLTDLIRLERPGFQDELRMAQDVVYYLPQFFFSLHQGIGIGITLIGLLFLLSGLHIGIPLAFALLGIPHLIVEQRLYHLKHTAMTRRSRAAREMDYCARITTEPRAAKEVRVFGLGDFFLSRFQDRFQEAFSEVSGIRLSQLRASAIFVGLHALAMVGGFWYVATQTSAGQFTLGDIALYLSALVQIQNHFLHFALWFGAQYETTLYLRGFFNFLNQAKPGIQLPQSLPAHSAPQSLQVGIHLKNLHFQYPEGAGPVLNGLSAFLPAGKVTALVGANGAGKSTLVKLLTRMYDPDSGEIQIDTMPLSAYDLASWRRQIAVTYQDFARFSLTLAENIALDKHSSQRIPIERAATWTGVDTIASKLPHGYDTQLTRQFEHGVDLSGGEWQKVSLARAFIRNASFIILDEPNAALDAEAEYHLFERFRELVAGKTALLITHRFSTVRLADYIIVIEDGGIVEAGSHTELIASAGRYATLYEMQAGRYRERA